MLDKYLGGEAVLIGLLWMSSRAGVSTFGYVVLDY